MKFILEINCDNATFEGHENTCAEVRRILLAAASRVFNGQPDGKLRDYNGNKVGSFRFSEDDSD